MVRTRVKICGLTRSEDVRFCVDSGADAIGLVFHAASPRFVSIDQAGPLLDACDPFVSTVGLFMDETEEWVNTVLDTCPLDLLQFHGQEDAAFCESFGRPYIKAVPMKGEMDVQHYMAQHPKARGFLLDSHALGEQGGSGKVFDWTTMPKHEKPLIVAGGLNADNVAEAIRLTNPYAVDVSSGVERARGIKDHDKIKRFMQQVAEAK